MEEIVKEFDDLHTQRNSKQICDLFETKYNTDEYKTPELLWRYARALRTLSIDTKDKAKYKELLVTALAAAKSGLDKDSTNPGCNKWYGILLDLTGRIEGIKKRIENSFEVKKYLEIANVNSDQNDAGVLHSLGVWCYEVSALSWLNRKLAATFFATPPTSTFEEALQYLTAAEKVSPGFYAPNYLYIGKTYDQLKKKVEAKEYFQKCLDFPGDDGEINSAKEEARELIKKC